MKKEFYLKTGGRKSKMRISGVNCKKIQRNQTGFVRIAMMEEYFAEDIPELPSRELDLTK